MPIVYEILSTIYGVVKWPATSYSSTSLTENPQDLDAPPPVGRVWPYRLSQQQNPEPTPPWVHYGCIVRSYQPIVVQHTCLHSHQAAYALMSTVAYPSTRLRPRCPSVWQGGRLLPGAVPP